MRFMKDFPRRWTLDYLVILIILTIDDSAEESPSSTVSVEVVPVGLLYEWFSPARMSPFHAQFFFGSDCVPDCYMDYPSHGTT